MLGQPAMDNWDKWLIPKVCYNVKVKVLQGYIARITQLKPSNCWQSTRSKVVTYTHRIKTGHKAQIRSHGTK